MCKNCRTNANLIAKPTAIPGFLIGQNDDPYYTVERRFTKYSSLKAYLSEKFPKDVTSSKQDYTLYKILELIEKIVDTEKLYDTNNPGLIIGDDDFASALNTRVILTSNVHSFVVRQLKLPMQSLKIIKNDGPKLEANHDVHDWVHLPKWASEEATMVKAAKITTNSIEECRLWEVRPKLKKFMNQINNKLHERSLFKFEEIVMTIVRSIREEKFTKHETSHYATVTITDDLLKEALEGTALDQTQLIPLVQLKLIRNHEAIPSNIHDALDKAMEFIHRSNQGKDEPHKTTMFFMMDH